MFWAEDTYRYVMPQIGLYLCLSDCHCIVGYVCDQNGLFMIMDIVWTLKKMAQNVGIHVLTEFFILQYLALYTKLTGVEEKHLGEFTIRLQLVL